MPDFAPVDRAALAAPFVAEGRISARRGAEGFAGQFIWTHDGERDEIVLAAPLGQTIATLRGDASSASAVLSDGRERTARDWDTLTSEALGLPLPVGGLSAWLRGLPHPGSAHRRERDRAGRTAQLRQDGWDVDYAYKEAAAQASRITLRYFDGEPIEVRIVVDQWAFP